MKRYLLAIFIFISVCVHAQSYFLPNPFAKIKTVWGTHDVPLGTNQDSTWKALAIYANSLGVTGSGTQNSIPKWNNAGGTSLGNSQWTDNGTTTAFTGVLNIPTTSSSTVGVINQNGSRFIHSYGTTNFFAGSSAGNFTLTSAGLVGIGAFSLISNGSGQRNTGVGYATIGTNVTGSANTAMGYLALSTATTSNNSAFGSNVLASNSTGNTNSGFGASALTLNTTGSFNSGFGSNSLSNSTTGFNNTAIGYQSGFTITSGSNNTLLGYNADAANATTNSIALGSGAVINANNQIVFGQTATPVNKWRVAGVEWVMPSSQGSANTIFTNDGSGNLSWGTLSGAGIVTGALNSGYIPYATGATTLADGLLYQSGNGLDIGGTHSSSVRLYITGTGSTSGSHTMILQNAAGNHLAEFRNDLKLIIGSVGSPATLQFFDGNQAANKILTSDASGNATWQTPATSGTVTSVTGTTNRITVATGTTTPVIDISASYVGQSSLTTLGTITSGTWNGTKISEIYGGTNQATYTTGDVLYASASNTLSKLAIGSSGQVLTIAAGVPSWATPTTGTVTSVGFTGGLISVANPTTTPAFTVAGTSGGIPYFSSSSTWASSAALAANALLIGGGAGAAPASTTTGTGVLTALGVNTGSAGAFVVNGGAGGTPSSLTLTNATGLPVAGGGTGNSTFTAYSVICAGTTSTSAFQNVSGIGTSGQVLTSNGTSALPTWQAASGGNLTVGSTTIGSGTTTRILYDNAGTLGEYTLTGSGTAVAMQTAPTFTTSTAITGTTNTQISASATATGTTGQGSMFAQNTTNSALVQMDAFGSASTGTIGGANKAGMASLRLYPQTGGSAMIAGQGSYPLIFAVNDIEYMRIHSTGNIGMGSATGNSALSFYYPKATNASHRFMVENTTNGSAASASVEVASSSGQLGFYSYATSFTGSGLTVGNSSEIFSNQPAGIYMVSSAGPLIFASNNSERIRVLSGGNVGIGTTTPGSLLDVNGTANIAGVETHGAPITMKAYTVATLPAGTVGQIAYVTDALAPAFLTVVAGGGASVTPVFYNGTNWVGF